MSAQGNELLLAAQKPEQTPHQTLRAIWRMNFASNDWEKLWEEHDVKPGSGESNVPVGAGLVIVSLPDGTRAVVSMGGI